MNRIFTLFATVALILISGLNAYAAPEIWLAPTGSNAWTVMGSGLEGIGGIDFTIRYETTLSNPRVVNGSVVAGAMALPNTNNPGVIRFGAVSANAFSKTSGDIAVISFASGKGKILSFSSQLATSSSNPQLVQVTPVIRDSSSDSTQPGISTSTSTATDQLTGTSTGSSTSTGTSSTSAAGGSVWLGAVTTAATEGTPGDAKEQAKQPEIQMEPQKSEIPAEKTAELQAEPVKQPLEEKSDKKQKYVTFDSVIDKFKEFKGEKTPKELLSLFNPPAKGFRQQPAVFLADGKSVMKVSIPLNISATASPNFAISKEAKMASLPKVDGENWVIEIRPIKDAYNVVLSYFLDEVSTDVPLTVAPLLKLYKGKPFNKMTESDFVQFLARTEPSKPDLAKDLNGDSKLDYVDEFIFTANYLVQAPIESSSVAPKKIPETPLKSKPNDETGKPAKK